VGDDRLTVLSLQLGDFVGQVAAGDIGLRPAFCAGLQWSGLIVAGPGLRVPEVPDAGGSRIQDCWSLF